MRPPVAAPPPAAAPPLVPPPPRLSQYSFVPAVSHHAPPPPAFQAAPAAAKKKKKVKSSESNKQSKTTTKQRGGQFDTKELKSLFNTIEKILPIGLREWEVVLDQHNKVWSAKEREVRGLRQKFNRLNGSKLPTGDPNCPWDVRWAKQLKKKIDEKADSNLLNDVSEPEDEAGRFDYS